MRNGIKLLVLLLITTFGYAQQPAPGSKEYERMKQEGTLTQPPVVGRQRNYPVLQSVQSLPMELPANAARSLGEEQSVAEEQSTTVTSTPIVLSTASSSVANCVIENPDPSFTRLKANDDSSTSAIPLPFTFNFFGTNYTKVYINTNGNISFDSPNSTYTATGFPSNFDMICPFWADVDTRGNSGLVYYKTEPTRLTVIWHQVGYYEKKADKVNTFKVVITDGADGSIGAGNNVAFFYSDMQWTTGDASGGINGFGGTPATVGLNNGQGIGNCFYFQLGRFGKQGTEFTDPYLSSGVDYLDNKCFTFDASAIQEVNLDFTYEKMLCAINFKPVVSNPQNCQIIYTDWDFGDGSVSSDWAPIHAYNAPGTYTATFNAYYECGACSYAPVTISKQITVSSSSDAVKDTLISVYTDVRPQILTSSVTTFSDAWSLEQPVLSLNKTHGFVNGTQGVWRSDGSYVYEVPRQLSAPLTLATDGSYAMDQFSWEGAEFEAIPNWIKTNTMTQYSPYSYELENKDVLGNYTAALYDYGGHLPSANGVNMRHAEMAYTGFEYMDGKSSGNWIFGNQPLPQYYLYNTLFNYKNIVVVKASLDELKNVQKVDVIGKSLFRFRHQTKTITDNEIVCRRVHPSNPEWSLLVLKQALFSTIWIGQVKINNEITPVVSPDIDQTFGHTGKGSLKITAEKTFEQTLVRLDSGKVYMISAWVSVKNLAVSTPKLADNLGIDVFVKDNKNVLLSTTSLLPSGSIIEGWQQVKGTFVCPDHNLHIDLKFKPGSTLTAWYDDLRMHPNLGNMRSYVYNLNDYRLQAILDEENFASFFYYDTEGNLYLTKKETDEGVKTLTENATYMLEH